jgi:hypothetical protein
MLCLSFCFNAKGQTSGLAMGQVVTIGWDAEADTNVAGYRVYYGTQSHNYSSVVDVGTNTAATVLNLDMTTNYFFVVTSYTTDGIESVPSDELVFNYAPAPFFYGQVQLSNNVQFLTASDGNPFGYYTFLSGSWLYHVDLGYEYYWPIADGMNGVVLYDYASGSFWYTTPAVWPQMYDFSVGSWIYYYPLPNDPTRFYSGPRYFWNYTTASVFSK